MSRKHLVLGVKMVKTVSTFLFQTGFFFPHQVSLTFLLWSLLRGEIMSDAIVVKTSEGEISFHMLCR